MAQRNEGGLSLGFTELDCDYLVGGMMKCDGRNGDVRLPVKM